MQPVTPHFKTDIRAQNAFRPLPLSFEEQEEALLLEMQTYSFKSKPVNKRIFQSMGELGEKMICVGTYPGVSMGLFFLTVSLVGCKVSQALQTFVSFTFSFFAHL